MAKEKKEKKTKATVEDDIDCPHCGGAIHVRHYRIRTNPRAKAQWKVWTEVMTQDQLKLDLEGDSDGGGSKTTAEPK